MTQWNERELYERANKLSEMGEYDRAHKLFKVLAEQNPTWWVYWNMVGYCEVELGEIEEAKHHFQHALELGGLQTTLYNNVAWAYNEEENFTKARELLEPFIIHHTNDATLHYTLANAYYGEKRYHDALVHFTRALEIDPSFEVCYWGKGLALMRLGNAKEAIHYFEHVIKQQPQHEDALYFLSKCLFQEKEYHRHIDMATRLLQMDELDHEIRYDRAQSYIHTNERKKAQSDLEWILDYDFENEEAQSLFQELQKAEVLVFPYMKTKDVE